MLEREAALGGGMDASVRALTVFNGQLIAGGFFTTSGGTSANCIAAWNGTSWSSLDNGTDVDVLALTIYNSQLIAGGSFKAPANYIAAWNGSAWYGLGPSKCAAAKRSAAPSLRSMRVRATCS